MTNEKAIKILKNHKEHWQRLLKEHICDKTEGEEFLQVLSIAINAIEAVDYDCANCIWYLKANNSDYPDLEQDEREREETE